MSILLPSGLPFGRLSVEESWLEFDGPRLFIARNRSGQGFLFNAIDEDDSSITYLAVPVSEDRRAMLRSGGLGLRAAYTAPQDGFVLRVTCNYDDESVDVVPVAPEDLVDDDLPTPDAVIAVSTETLPAFDPGALQERARAEGRTLVALRLNPPTLQRTEYPVRPLSDALRAMQSLTEALVQEQSGEATVRGPLPSHVVEDGELALLELEAASFVAILAPSRSARSTPTSPSLGFELAATSSALAQMQTLLGAVAVATTNADSLRTEIQGLGVRAITKIRDLLEVALDQNTPLVVYVAPPNEPVTEVRISTAEASSGVLVLSEKDEGLEELVLTQATLVGINLRTWVFELHDSLLEPHKFSGKVMEHARPEIEGLPTGEAHRYVAEIVAATSISNLTDEVKVKYSLKSIRSGGDGGVADTSPSRPDT